MSVATILCAILLVVCSVALIVVVALQHNRGGGMSALTGNNGNNSGKGQGAKREFMLKQLTVIFGLLFIVVVFALNIVVSVGLG